VACAAVAVAPNLAITANHCVPGDEVAFVTASRNGRAQRNGGGHVVGRESSSDLALFEASGLIAATLSPDPLDGEHATLLVTHVPAPWSVLELHPRGAHDGYVQTERLEVGMSGSGLWDDGGRLVGIAVGNDASAGYFAGTARIRALLAQAPAGTTLRAPAANAALWGDDRLPVEALVVSLKRQRAAVERRLEQLEGHAPD
jgi:hypothetical protein